jgi:hypothetical protein
MSKNYGKSSPEARLAREAVEEVKSADNSEAMKGSFDEKCDVVDEYYDIASKACLEHNSQLEQ